MADDGGPESRDLGVPTESAGGSADLPDRAEPAGSADLAEPAGSDLAEPAGSADLAGSDLADRAGSDLAGPGGGGPDSSGPDVLTPGELAPDQARDWLARVRAVRGAVRRARPGYWFPLLVFGVIVLISTPLYVTYPGVPPGPGSGSPVVTGVLVDSQGSPPEFFPTGMFAADPTRQAVFWLVALPLGFLLITLYYGLRARRRGVEVSLDAFLLVGLAVFGALILAALAGATFLLGDLDIRGLLPLFVIGAALVVLAGAQRSLAQLTYALAFLALCLVANLYDMENVVNRIFGAGYGTEANVVIMGIVLLLGALGFGVAALADRAGRADGAVRAGRALRTGRAGRRG